MNHGNHGIRGEGKPVSLFVFLGILGVLRGFLFAFMLLPVVGIVTSQGEIHQATTVAGRACADTIETFA